MPGTITLAIKTANYRRVLASTSPVSNRMDPRQRCSGGASVGTPHYGGEKVALTGIALTTSSHFRNNLAGTANIETRLSHRP
jgi:hypothetical protein